MKLVFCAWVLVDLMCRASRVRDCHSSLAFTCQCIDWLLWSRCAIGTGMILFQEDSSWKRKKKKTERTKPRCGGPQRPEAGHLKTPRHRGLPICPRGWRYPPGTCRGRILCFPLSVAGNNAIFSKSSRRHISERNKKRIRKKRTIKLVKQISRSLCRPDPGFCRWFQYWD